ncbi:MAG: HAD family hydrolase [Bacillota bacterium]|nr:HAD family hydrolase [Bacillota bacterium]
MFKALLFDLDGTLVPMNMDHFMREYFRAVTHKFANLVQPEKLVREILNGTMAMINNTDPEKTNKEVFWSHFLSRVNLPEEVLVPMFDEFYVSEFADLKCCAHPNPLARPLMDLLFEKGFQVAIATNPVFPERAIRERMSWVEIGDLPYALVTTYENSHFCKPRVEYYEEVIGHLGVKPQECLMIGNDVEEDLVARKLGVRTFLVEDWLLNPRDLPIETDYRGSFRDLASFLNGLRVAVTPAPGCEIRDTEVSQIE